jgi:hypothetical protein
VDAGPGAGIALEGLTVEMAIGIALVVIAAIEIVGIVRVVSANLNIGR